MTESNRTPIRHSIEIGEASFSGESAGDGENNFPPQLNQTGLSSNDGKVIIILLVSLLSLVEQLLRTVQELTEGNSVPSSERNTTSGHSASADRRPDRWVHENLHSNSSKIIEFFWENGLAQIQEKVTPFLEKLGVSEKF